MLALGVTLLLSSVVHAADMPSLPSRDSLVVLPLLRKFSSADHFKSILKILGEEDMDLGSVFLDTAFKLTDNSMIFVFASTDGNTVYSITHASLDKSRGYSETLYQNWQALKNR